MSIHFNIIKFIRGIGSGWVEYNRKLLIDVIFESEPDEFLQLQACLFNEEFKLIKGKMWMTEFGV